MNYEFNVTIVQDMDTPHEKITIKTFTSALQAVNYYTGITDYGFAAYGREITLYEPNGLKQRKYFCTDGAHFEEYTTRVQVVAE